MIIDFFGTPVWRFCIYLFLKKFLLSSISNFWLYFLDLENFFQHQIFLTTFWLIKFLLYQILSITFLTWKIFHKTKFFIVKLKNFSSTKFFILSLLFTRISSASYFLFCFFNSKNCLQGQIFHIYYFLMESLLLHENFVYFLPSF